MRPRQRRASARRRARSGLAVAVGAQCAALFVATAFAVAAPGAALSQDEGEQPTATGEMPSSAEAAPQPSAALAAAPEVPAPPVGAASDDARPHATSPGPAAQDGGASPAEAGAPSADAPADGGDDVAARAAAPPGVATPGPVAASDPLGARSQTAPPAAIAAPAAPGSPQAEVAPAPPARADRGSSPLTVVQDTPPAIGCPVDAILGTDGPDVLTGTPGPDFICGLGGDDTIDGGAGDDMVDGGPGDDTLGGGTGNDTVAGRGGDDKLAGEAGNDCLAGGAGDDRLDGGPGDDTLDGQGGENILIGGGGVDAGSEPLIDEQFRGSLTGSFDPATGVCSRTQRWPTDTQPVPGPPGPAGPESGDGEGGGIVDFLERELKKGLAKLGVEEANAARLPWLAVFPLRRPRTGTPLEGRFVRLRVTCFGNFTRLYGDVTLRTLAEGQKDARLVGESTPFICTKAHPRPEVRIEVPLADRRRIRRVGRLKVRATATDATGKASPAQSFFTLVPERP